MTNEVWRCINWSQRRSERPALLGKAKQILQRWRSTVSPVPSSIWMNGNLLDQGPDACLAVAVEDSERAAALRQASPLACLLTPKERFEFLKSWGGAHASQ
ncbi:MAG: hypothetical protein IPP84_03820 [Propionivibrio sp.]|uniref:hypothetical protein n=1 Tax=Propionivibrio sp. TaxID=2212460 RepID=UPI0025FED94B|nr:hypothetical protein [Propionivibrio sp.]MBL0207118.1 hypothetical protein [Propionivibrio sp.]